MADNILISTGSGFEGYEILDYKGFISSQALLGSNFLSGIASTVSDVSEKDMAKLEKCRETAAQRLLKLAEKKEANAIVGLKMTYTSLDGGSFGVVMTGNAVVIKKKIVVDNSIHKELYVTNYYTGQIPRPVKVIIDGTKDDIDMKVQCYNYNNEEILSIRTDLEFTNLYDERLLVKNVDFAFEKANISLIESSYIQSQLSANDIQLLKDVKVTVTKYVTPRGIIVCGDTPVNVDMSYKRLQSLKAKRGIDAVARYRTDGMIWTCNCGHVNEAGLEECIICGRKQKDIMVKASFDYESMIAEMREKEYVIEIKDVLMGHLKEINTKYRMPLLEIMESGLQYEKTRGNMKDSVIEKVEKLFEEDSEE